MKLKIKKGDKVKIMVGKDKGSQGVVEKVFPKSNKVLVAGHNIYKKHAKARRQGQQGGIIDVPKPLSVSSVAVICPKCGSTSRVSFQLGEKKLRICRKCKEVV